MGSTERKNTGSGTRMPGRNTGVCSVALTSVSPVLVCFRPTTAPMCPAGMEAMSTLDSACSSIRRRGRSLTVSGGVYVHRTPLVTGEEEEEEEEEENGEGNGGEGTVVRIAPERMVSKWSRACNSPE